MCFPSRAFLILHNYNFSIKNILIPSEGLYKITLIEKVELSVKRMRWEAHLFDNTDFRRLNLLCYFFKSRKSPPQHKDFLAYTNSFQDQLRKNIMLINKLNNIYIFAFVFTAFTSKTTTNY